MGNRSYIQINGTDKDTPVLLYGHYSGTDNLTAVRNVLAKTARIGDFSYLTAQLFYEFAIRLGSYDGSLSFGIETGHLTGDEWTDAPSVVVNALTGEYFIDGEVFTEFAVQIHEQPPKDHSG